MILIGESINIMRKDIREAIKSRDKKPIQELAIRQKEAGADMLDINIGPVKKEGYSIAEWLIDVIEEVVDLPLSWDTSNKEAMEVALKKAKNKILINSVSAQKSKLEDILPLAKKYDAEFIAVLNSDSGIPSGIEERTSILMEILNAAEALGINHEKIWVDAIVFPVCHSQQQIVDYMEFMKLLPDIVGMQMKSTCGLSNVSNGTPTHLRPILNRTFLILLADIGIHSVICDVLDQELVNIARKIEGLQKEEGMSFLDYFKDENLHKTAKVLKNESIYCHSWLEV